MKVVTNDGGLNYQITEANLTRDTWYSIDISKSGYEFNIPNIYVPIPYEPIPVNMNILMTGFFNKIIIELNYNVPNITIQDLTFTPSTSIFSITSTNMGLTYIIDADLAPNTSYTINIEKYGYTFTATRFLTQKEFLHDYSMYDVVTKFGLDPSRYIAQVENFRLLGDVSNVRYFCVPVVDTNVTRVGYGSLYGILFCNAAKNGINDWHFLNAPDDLIAAGFYSNTDLSYMSICDVNSIVKIYFLNMIREDLWDSSTKSIGYLYSLNMASFVDGQPAPWKELIDEYLWSEGNDYDSVNNHEYWLGMGPLVLSSEDSRCRIMGYKFKPYWSEISSLTSIWNRDMISINPKDESQIWWQTELSSYQANSYPCTWYIKTNGSLSFTRTAGMLRVKTNQTGNPIYGFTLLSSNTLPTYKPLDYRAGVSSSSYRIMPIDNYNKVVIFNNEEDSVNFSDFYVPNIAFEVGLTDFRMSQYGRVVIQQNNGEIESSRTVFILSMYMDANEMAQFGLQNPTLYWSWSGTGRSWYPREIVKNDKSLTKGFQAIANFKYDNEGVMLFEYNKPIYNVYYLPNSSTTEPQFYRTKQYEITGQVTAV